MIEIGDFSSFSSFSDPDRVLIIRRESISLDFLYPRLKVALGILTDWRFQNWICWLLSCQPRTSIVYQSTKLDPDWRKMNISIYEYLRGPSMSSSLSVEYEMSHIVWLSMAQRVIQNSILYFSRFDELWHQIHFRNHFLLAHWLNISISDQLSTLPVVFTENMFFSFFNNNSFDHIFIFFRTFFYFSHRITNFDHFQVTTGYSRTDCQMICKKVKLTINPVQVIEKSWIAGSSLRK